MTNSSASIGSSSLMISMSRAIDSGVSPYRDMRKLALLAREKIGHKHLLTETDRLLRNSRHLISRTRELIRQTQHLNGSLGRYQHNEDHCYPQRSRLSGQGRGRSRDRRPCSGVKSPQIRQTQRRQDICRASDHSHRHHRCVHASSQQTQRIVRPRVG